MNKKRDALRRGIRDLIEDTSRDLVAFEGREPAPRGAAPAGAGTTKPEAVDAEVREAADPAIAPADTPALNGGPVEIAGVVPTMYDARTSIGKEILNGIRDYFGEKVFASAIHFNIKLVESSMIGVPVFVHLPPSRGAAEYMSLAKEVMALEQKAGRAPARN